jgi:hypothetical protein
MKFRKIRWKKCMVLQQHKRDPEWQLNRAVRMALIIEYSPAVQEVPGSIPGWDATFSDALCKGCRWLWSSLYSTVYQCQCKLLELGSLIVTGFTFEVLSNTVSNNFPFPIFFVVSYHRTRRKPPHLCQQINLTWKKPYDSVCLSKTMFIDSRILSQTGIFADFLFHH